MLCVVVAVVSLAAAAPPSTPPATAPSPSAPATDTAADADKGAALLEKARKAERELEYPQAKTTLVELFATPGVSDEALVEGHLLAGAIERVLENDTEARLHFLYVLRRSPTYALAEDAPPKVRNFFELVREEVKAEQKPQASTPEPAPPPERSLAGPVVAAVGGAVVAVSLVAALVGEVAFADAGTEFKNREGGRILALAGWTGAVVGVGLGVTGAVLWVSE